MLETVILGDYAARDLFIAAGAAVVFLIFLGIIMRRLRKKGGSPHFQSVDCFNCGWHGKVSRYAGRCPQCNQPLGEQKARRSA